MCFSRSFFREAILAFQPYVAAIFSLSLLIFSLSSCPLLCSCLILPCLRISSSSSSLFLSSNFWSLTILSLIIRISRIFSSNISFLSAQYSSILLMELFFSRSTFQLIVIEQFSLSSGRGLPMMSVGMVSRDIFLLLRSVGSSSYSVSSRWNSSVRWEKYLLRSGKGAFVFDACEVQRRRLLNFFILASTSYSVFWAFSKPRRVSSWSESEMSIQICSYY